MKNKRVRGDRVGIEGYRGIRLDACLLVDRDAAAIRIFKPERFMAAIGEGGVSTGAAEGGPSQGIINARVQNKLPQSSPGWGLRVDHGNLGRVVGIGKNSTSQPRHLARGKRVVAILVEVVQHRPRAK
jgi:hypothetical protein